MGKIYEHIDDKLAAWVSKQRIFFVSTAPSDVNAHINCSPKGGDSFRVIGGSEVAYQDYTGSGVETIAHLRENGRIVIMFCAFEGPARIVKFHGRGSVISKHNQRYEALSRLFPPNLGTRAIIQVAVSRISDSCGYGVPLYELKKPRDALDKWAANKGEDGLKAYRRENNSKSIDGLPGIDAGRNWEGSVEIIRSGKDP